MRTLPLDLLVSPLDGGALHERDGGLAGPGGDRYAVREGVPRLVPGENGAALGESDGGTAKSFGGKWALLSDDERDRLAAFQFEWYDRRFGWGGEEALASHLAGCETVLDAGTGTGYDAARYARLCPGRVIGMDLSESVTAAATRWSGVENLTFVQGDIMRPPLAPASLDFVVSDQVIHHTPDCRQAFLTLARLLRPGGQLSVYVYREKALMRELADTHVRELTTAMSFEDCMSFSEDVTELGRELSRTGAKVTLERGVPLLGIEPGEHDVQRLIYWCFLKCFWNEDWGHELNVLTNFDWYHPPYASRHTPEEVEGWCAEAGLQVLHLDVIESGVSVRAQASS